MLLHLIALFYINIFYIKIYRENVVLINSNIIYQVLFIAALLINNTVVFRRGPLWTSFYNSVTYGAEHSRWKEVNS